MVKTRDSGRLVVVVAGTPGVGKSTIAKALAEKLNGVYVNLSELALSRNLVSYYDGDRETYVIDEEKVLEEVGKIVECNRVVVIDTHYPEILPNNVVNYVFVLRMNPLKLIERLRSRGWSTRKIRENALAELLSVVSTNVINAFDVDKVYEIDCTEISVEEVLNTILNTIRGAGALEHGLRFDWLVSVNPEEIDSTLGFIEGFE